VVLISWIDDRLSFANKVTYYATMLTSKQIQQREREIQRTDPSNASGLALGSVRAHQAARSPPTTARVRGLLGPAARGLALPPPPRGDDATWPSTRRLPARVGPLEAHARRHVRGGAGGRVAGSAG